MDRRFLSLPLAALLCLVLASPAMAVDRYVRKGAVNNANCTQAQPCLTIAAGVTAAQPGERVIIGAGTFEEAVVVNKRLTLEGVGSGPALAPFLAGTVTYVRPAANGTALRMTQGGTVRKMRFEGRTGANPGLGLSLEAAAAGGPWDYRLEDVVATGSAEAKDPANTSTDDPGVRVSDAGSDGTPNTPVTLTAVDSDFVGRGDTLPTIVSVGEAGLEVARTATLDVSATMESSTARASAFGAEAITVRNNSNVPSRVKLTMRRSSSPLGEQGQGLNVTNASTIDLDRSTLVGETQGILVNTSNPTVITARNSLFERRVADTTSSSTEAAIGYLTGANPAHQLNVTGSTLVAEDNASNSDVSGLVLRGDDATEDVVASFRNSVVRAFGSATGGVRFESTNGAKATVTADRSSVGALTGDVASTSFTPARAIAGDPRFVDAGASDFRLLADSPLIDAADSALLTAGELDLAGRSRLLDGNDDCRGAPDVGALEFAGGVGRPPAVAITSGPARVEAGTTASFTASATDPQTPLTTRWTLPGGTASGLTARAKLTRPGVNTVIFRATDARGCSAATSRTVTVDRALRPSFGKLGLKKRFRARKGARLTYRLSEASTVKLRFERKKGKRWRRVTTLTRKGRKGTNTLKIGRRLGGKRVRAGKWRVRLGATDGVGLSARGVTRRFTVLPPR